MKTLIATLSISAALLAPAAAFAATTDTTAPAQTSAQVARIATPANAQDDSNATRVAMNKQSDKQKSFGRQATDDREGLSRIVEQSHQLGATN